MGTWGHGNLESDGALGALEEECRVYFDRIRKLLSHENGHECDDVWHDELFVLLEIVFALHDRNLLRVPIIEDDLGAVCEDYIKRWSAYWLTYAKEPSEEREGVIRESFRALINLVEEAKLDGEGWTQVSPSCEADAPR